MGLYEKYLVISKKWVDWLLKRKYLFIIIGIAIFFIMWSILKFEQDKIPASIAIALIITLGLLFRQKLDSIILKRSIERD